MYLLKLNKDNETFYKIGITARSIEERFSRPRDLKGYTYEILILKSLAHEKAWDSENYIKNNYMSYSYKPKNKFAGHTECFNLDLPIEEIKNFLK